MVAWLDRALRLCFTTHGGEEVETPGRYWQPDSVGIEFETG